MQISKYFHLEEFIQSNEGTRAGIDNTPSQQISANIQATAEKADAVRELLTHPMLISSGYRCPKLNALVGGAHDSAHMSGWALDFICPAFGTPYEIAKAIQVSGIKYDQLIMEHTWVHISFDPQGRQMPLTLIAGGHYKPGIAIA